MKYINEIICTAVVCGILTKITPDSEKSGKYVRLICSFIFILALISPFVDIKEGEFDISADILQQAGAETSEIQHNYGADVISREICKAAVKSAAEELGVSEDVFSIKLEILKNEGDNFTIGEVIVYVNDSEDMVDIDRAEKCFGRIFSGAEKVVIR